MRMTRYLWIPMLGLVLAGCNHDDAKPGGSAPEARAASTQEAGVASTREAAADAFEEPAANGFIQLDDQQFPLETATLRCAPQETHDGVSEIRFQTFGKGGEGRDAYTVSAREQVHRNGTVTQHVSVAGQALGVNMGHLGISMGHEVNVARENGRNWPLYTIEAGRITVRATLRQSEMTAEWDVPAEFTEDCTR